MNHVQESSESHSSDPVLREIARMAQLILADPLLSRRERAQLIRRLEIEYHAYLAWKKQYASYFRTPRKAGSKKEA